MGVVNGVTGQCGAPAVGTVRRADSPGVTGPGSAKLPAPGKSKGTVSDS